MDRHVVATARSHFSAELYDILRNPMLLKMYALNVSEQVLVDSSHESHFLDNPITTGEIIWNFLEHQIIKSKAIYETGTSDAYESGTEEGFGKIMFRYLLPYIAYQVEKNEKTHFSLVDLEGHIDDYRIHFENTYKNFGDLIRYKRAVNQFLSHPERTAFLLKQCVDSFCIIKLRPTGRGGADTYDFIHQHFRDILSATHIRNQMILNDKTVFTERIFPFHIAQMLLEILQEHKYVPGS